MLEVRDLRVCYGAAPALWGVSLAMRACELSCVIGPNAAGKTTLVNAIAGLQPASAGTLTMDGRDMLAVAPHRFCGAGIAGVAAAYALTVDHGLREAAAEEARRVGIWLSARGIDHHILVWRPPAQLRNIQATARAARCFRV